MQTFNRILLYVYHGRYCEVQKAKNGNRGTIVFTAALIRVFLSVCLTKWASLILLEVLRRTVRNSGSRDDLREARGSRVDLLSAHGSRDVSHLRRRIVGREIGQRYSRSLEEEGVCVFFPFFLDIKFVGRTSRGHTGGRSHRIFHPPSFCGACLNFSRVKNSAIPFPRRP